MQTDRLYLRISDDLKRRLEALAQADRRQVSDYVRLVLEDHINEKENNVKTIGGIEYFRCGTGDLGEALAAHLVAQYAGHRIERNGTHYYHNAAFTLKMYQAYAAEAIR